MLSLSRSLAQLLYPTETVGSHRDNPDISTLYSYIFISFILKVEGLIVGLGTMRGYGLTCITADMGLMMFLSRRTLVIWWDPRLLNGNLRMCYWRGWHSSWMVQIIYMWVHDEVLEKCHPIPCNMCNKWSRYMYKFIIGKVSRTSWLHLRSSSWAHHWLTFIFLNSSSLELAVGPIWQSFN